MPDDDLPYTALLAADDWRPLTEYVPSTEYVYVKAFAYRAKYPCVAVARRGRHELSYWRQPPPNGPLPLSVVAWKPLPHGITPYDAAHFLYGTTNDGAFVRPPEPVYPPGGVDVRLTPVPLRLLHAMRDGARLHERAWRWTEWTLISPGQPPQKIGERGINPLRSVAFIARNGVLPPGRLLRWLEFDWSITAAGKRWLAAHPNITAV